MNLMSLSKLMMLSACMFFSNSSARGITEYIKSGYAAGDVKLVYENEVADIYLAPNEPIQVKRCVKDLADDIQRVTGKLPAIKNSTAGLSAHAIIVGTIDNSEVIKSLISEKKIDVSRVIGQWETFQIQTVANPVAGVAMGLVIAGSDKRGAIYGMYDVSENMGVSPWYWFADVAPEAQKNIVAANGMYREGPPSVKYRAIFINDEDWGIQPWSCKTFAPGDGGNGLGPTTYRRVFELLLRLKANHIWPAMHRDRTPFNYYPLNKFVADTFGIIMGSSHIEPLLRNCTTNGEWAKEGVGEFNYQTNAANVYKFWEKRVIENGMFENVYTLGKRGAEDQAMPEGGTTAQKVSILSQVITDQRKILSEHVNTDLLKVPQIFVPYKEVLDLYYAGLKVPDGVTIGWVDDNQGYIRALPDVTERARSGGNGVYYHISYWGWKDTYLWLTSIPPSLVWEEMNKAWEYEAKKTWIINVGDIKPAEISMEMFLEMAWDVTRYNAKNVIERMRRIIERDYGITLSSEIADIMNTYYHLNYTRKPEVMDTSLMVPAFSFDNYGDEGQKRIDEYVAIEKRATAVYNLLPSNLRDAFYQMVLYQVRCSMLQNQKMIYALKSKAYQAQNRASAASYGALAKTAYNGITTETNYYNNTMAGGKWKNMMNSQPMAFGSVFGAPSVSTFAGSGAANLNVRCEGGSAATLPSISGYNRDSVFVDLYSNGPGTVSWSATASASWIKLSKFSGSFSGDTRVWVSLDWASVPKGTSVSGSVSISGAGVTKSVAVPVFNPATPERDKVVGFVESNGYVSMEAEHFSRAVDRNSAGWQVVKDLGRNGDGVMVFPTTLAPITTASTIQGSSPQMEYDFHAFSSGSAVVQVYCLPNQSVDRGETIRYAVAVDNGTPVLANVGTATNGNQWINNVNSGSAVGSSSVAISSAGQHVLKVWMVEPGLVIDKIVINFGGVKPSYSGPPESFSNRFVQTGAVRSSAAVRSQPRLVRNGQGLVLFNPLINRCSLRIFNAQGRLVFVKDDVEQGKMSIRMDSFGAGFFVYRIVSGTDKLCGTVALFK
jgi:hypothetical protein